MAEHDVLLVFRKGTTEQTVALPSGTIPGHGGDGVLHVAFGEIFILNGNLPEQIYSVRSPVGARVVFASPRTRGRKSPWRSRDTADSGSRK